MSSRQQQNQREKWVKWRMIAIAAFFSLAMNGVIARVYYLQTVSQEDLQNRATPVDREITITPRRGQILDRHGAEMAITVKAPSIAARPRAIKDPAEVAKQLSPLLEIPVEELHKKLDPKRRFVWLKRQTTPQVAQAIKDLKIEGITLHDEHKRFYPQGDVAGQILGFVGIDGEGLEGIERSLDRKLAGSAIQIAGRRDARGTMMMTGDAPDFERFEGLTVELTIDERIQRVAQQALQEQVDKFEAKGGYAVVLDVKTGEILAMANTPSFDPNHFKDFDAKAWRLRAVTDTFEPGSVIKPMVLAAAMEEQKVGLRTSFDCEDGRIKIGRYTIRDSHAHSQLTAAEVVQVSSNICSYKIAQLMGKDTYYRYLNDFGFGTRAGLGVRGEQPGLIWPADRWAEVSFANIAFGQGFTATPLQTAAAIASLANGGLLMKPQIVRRVLNSQSEVIEDFEPQLVRRVVSPEVARKTAWAMSLVTTPNGTAPKATLDRFTVAGKTGTAQKVNPKTRRYDAKMWVASFVGFFPAEQPEVVIAVMVDEPQRTHYGGVVAAPAFKAIAEKIIQVRQIQPPAEVFDLSDLAGEPPKQSNKPEPKPIPAQEALQKLQQPDDGAVSLGVERILADPAQQSSGEQGVLVPDLRGLTLREALVQIRRLGAMPNLQGWGRVTAQDPAPGQPWQPGQPINLELSPASSQSLVAEEPSAGF